MNQNHSERTYRSLSSNDLIRSRVVVGESDLWILSNGEVKAQVTNLLFALRRQLKNYIADQPLFEKTLVPFPVDQQAVPIVSWMIETSARVGVGPMAAVAGAISGSIGKSIPDPSELIIENGGDIYLRSTKERIVAIYAGNSPFSNKIGLKLKPAPQGIGVCTSAGTVGPSLSFGKADAAVIISPDAALADAAATASANLIQKASDLKKTVEYIKKIPGISGVLFIKDDKIAAWGDIELTALD